MRVFYEPSSKVQGKTGMRFANKLTAAVVVISTITVPTLGVAIFYQSKNTIQEIITTEQVAKTRSILNLIDRSLFDAYQDIQLISKDSHLEILMKSVDQPGTGTEDPVGHRFDVAEFDNKIQLTGPWDLVSVLNEKGDIVYSSHSSRVGENIKRFPADATSYFAAIAGRNYYSDLLISDLTNRPTVIFSAPIKNEKSDAILGVVMGHFTWPVILQILDGTHSSNQVRLINRDGVVIATPSQEKERILNIRLGKYDLVKRLFSGKLTSSGIVTLDEKTGPVLATAIAQDGYLSYRGHNWALLLGVPTQTAFASVLKTAANITISIVVIMIVIISVIYLFARHIAAPVEILRNAAKAIGHGDYDYRINIKSGDELEQLGDSISQMAKDRKQAEQELHAAQVGLVKQERLAALGQLTATVSHELRNPLATMGTSTNLMRRKFPTVAETSAFIRLERAMSRCDHIVDELLDYTRKPVLNLESIGMDAYLDEYLAESPLSDGIEMRRERYDAEIKISIDKNLMRRVLVNVTNNASQALHQSDGEKQVTITTSVEGNRCRVVVGDNGPGIPADIQEKIFEPLFSTKNFGVGLGMSIVQQIMQQLDGEVVVESEVGRGTQVSLWLPLTDGKEPVHD
jgi:signal transduction histidine kinase